MPATSASGPTELLGFRTAPRRFLHWREEQARDTPAGLGPAVGELSDYLVSKHHSVVELIDRAVKAGLVERHRDAGDHRIVHLLPTTLGEERIEELSRLHLEELRTLPRWPEEED
jgi:DNA-binding MarR family transcriptional regulator